MSEQENNRSGLQTAASLARLGNAARRIAKAAAGIVAALIVLPMLIISAIPSIFFGYDTSETESIVRMNQQAAGIGSVCMSVEEFDRAVIDAIVTSIAAEYEAQGKTIDRIEVISRFDKESLEWFTAINSVAHQQNLEEMSVSEIREMCSAKLNRSSFLFGTGETTLRITVEKLDPNEWMDKLGFSEEAKTWAGAIFETFSESDAMAKYAARFPNVTDYSGDGGYTGVIQHGDAFGTDIDTSRFIDPAGKNAHDLAAYAVQAWENNWGYVWGTFGNVLTPSLLEYKVQQYPDGVGKYRAFIEQNYLGRRTADCIGLIKSYGWFDAESGQIKYGSHGVPDYNADQMYNNAVNSGSEHGEVADMPDIPGLVLWKKGHTGVYIGGGYAVEAMGTSKGVCKTEVAGRGWQAWYKLPYISYEG